MFFGSNFGALELQIVQYIQRGREIFTASEAIASDAVVLCVGHDINLTGSNPVAGIYRQAKRMASR